MGRAMLSTSFSKLPRKPRQHLCIYIVSTESTLPSTSPSATRLVHLIRVLPNSGETKYRSPAAPTLTRKCAEYPHLSVAFIPNMLDSGGERLSAPEDVRSCDFQIKAMMNDGVQSFSILLFSHEIALVNAQGRRVLHMLFFGPRISPPA